MTGIIQRPANPLSSSMARLWHHLSERRRRQSALLFGLMLLSACAEVVSLGAALPFLGVLTAPDVLFKRPLIADAAQRLGINSPEQLVLPLTLAFAVAALLAGAIRMLLLWGSTRLAAATGSDLSLEVYRRTLYQPYSVHVARNSSQVISGITYKVQGVVFGVLLPSLTLLSSGILLITITMALIAIDPFVASVATTGFGACYALIAWLSRRRVHANSQRIAHEQTQVVKAVQEALGGIRDVLLDGTQGTYCEIYQRADRPWQLAQGNNMFLSGSPRYAMEAVGMVLIAALAYAISRQSGGMAAAAALPVLGVLALGAQRLIPALQLAYSAWVTIGGNRSSLEDTIALLDQPVPPELLQPAPPPLRFHHAIEFDAVRFRYSGDGDWVLDGIDLVIRKGSRIGLVGGTGSGKSTMLDLLMGLLLPTEGKLLIDDLPISGNRLRAWQRTIAHVPQSIYLADASLAENIAFGVPRDSIDLERVHLAARQAQIEDFIAGRADGYQAFAGERGIRLSGGQRQRIGIARALYKQASVLILDEATSALDNATERSVMDAIEQLDRDFTILIVAHRLTTVRRCDAIVELAQGKVAAQGKYEELLECSPSFRHLANALG